VRAPVLTHVLRTERRSVLQWSAAVALVAGLYTAAYPAVGGSKADVVGNLPQGLVTALDLGAIGTPAGYLASTVYGIVGPALLLTSVVTRGARLLAGQEEDGTLELELTHPVSRRRVYGERLAATALSALGLVVVLTGAVVLAGRVIGLQVGVGHVLAGSTGLLLVVLAVGTVTFAAGAATGRRAVALGAGAGVGLASYVANALGSSLGLPWLVHLTPWSWYLGAQPLSAGVDVAGVAKLAVLALLAAVVGAVAFDHRDLGC
jgi:ABC-2 type transport system permease protein